MCKKIISVVVILAFVYSNFIWADPQLGTVNNLTGKETLAYDTNGFVGRLNHASSEDITTAWMLEKTRPEVFNETRSRVEKGNLPAVVQSILVKRLFSMFGEVLKGIKESDVTRLFTSGEGIVLHTEFGEHVLSMQGEGEEVNFILKTVPITPKTRNEEGFSILPVLLLITFAILQFAMSWSFLMGFPLVINLAVYYGYKAYLMEVLIGYVIVFAILFVSTGMSGSFLIQKLVDESAKRRKDRGDSTRRGFLGVLLGLLAVTFGCIIDPEPLPDDGGYSDIRPDRHAVIKAGKKTKFVKPSCTSGDKWQSCRLDLDKPIDITENKENGEIEFEINWLTIEGRDIVLQLLPQTPNVSIEKTDIGTCREGSGYKIFKLKPGLNRFSVPIPNFGLSSSSYLEVYAIVVHFGQEFHSKKINDGSTNTGNLEIRGIVFPSGAGAMDSGPGGKARIEDQIPAGALRKLAKKVWKGKKPNFSTELYGRYFYSQGEAFTKTIRYRGVGYTLSYEGESYFSILVQDKKGSAVMEIYAIPISPNEVVIPGKLARELTGLRREDIIYAQKGIHEEIEMGDIQIFQDLYSDLSNEVKAYVQELLKRLGVGFKIDRYGKIGNFKSESPHLRHLLAEVAELMVEYRYRQGDGEISDVVSMSSLDAALLLIRLKEITGAPLDSSRMDVLIEGLTRTKLTTRRLILSMVADDIFDLDIIERTAEALSEVEASISTINTRENGVRTILLYAGKWAEENRRIKELSSILGEDLLNRFKTGIEKRGYRGQWWIIEDILILIRYEVGRTVRVGAKGATSIDIGNPYLHSLMSKLSQMAGIRTEELAKAYYGDLIQEQEVGRSPGLRTRLVDSAVRIALTEAEHARYQGLIALSEGQSANLVSCVNQLAAEIYKGRANGDERQIQNLTDLAIALEQKADPLGIMADLLTQSSCRKIGGAVANYLAQEHAVLARRSPAAAGLDISGKGKKVIISLGAIMDVIGYDNAAKTLSVEPKGIGLGRIAEALKKGNEIEIVDLNRDRLAGIFPDEVPDGFSSKEECIDRAIEEALANIFGITSGIKLSKGSLSEVLKSIEDPLKTVVFVQEGEIPDSELMHGKFVYEVRSGELLIDAIAVGVNVEFSNNTFDNNSKDLLRRYYNYLLPLEEKEKMMVEVNKFIEGFSLLSNIIFRLPPAVRFTQLLEGFRFTLLVDLSA